MFQNVIDLVVNIALLGGGFIFIVILFFAIIYLGFFVAHKAIPKVHDMYRKCREEYDKFKKKE